MLRWFLESVLECWDSTRFSASVRSCARGFGRDKCTMRFPWILMLAVLLVSEVALAAAVTRTEGRKPDGSLAFVREVDLQAGGESTVTHMTYGHPHLGDVRIVFHLNDRGQTTWVMNRVGVKISYTRDEHDRIVQVTWDTQSYALAYNIGGAVSAIHFPDPAVQVKDFRSLRWNGLALVGEVRETGEQKILIPDPTAIPGEA